MLLVKRIPVHATEICLRDVVARSLILTCSEKADQLLSALIQEGLNPRVIVASYSSDELTYARNTRTFMNHYTAWKIASAKVGYTIICESDFVPCRGIGSFPVFWPLHDELAYGYLYQGSPRLLALIGDVPYLRGHTTPLVAYVVNPRVAEILLKFYDDQMSRYRPQDYFTFDSHLQWFAMGQGAHAYIPLWHYGEHGGFPNSEHTTRGRLSRAGIHRADNLYSPLYFLPAYASGSRTNFALERLQARALGWARLLSGRWIVQTNVYKIPLSTRLRMYLIGMRRLLGF